MLQHVYHILFRPYHSVSAVFVEETVIAVLAFRCIPFVEILDHEHDAHLVAELHKFLSRHIV